ncbi:unnamed protein product [Pleuronectes platessa]|uniref:Uncharacterized protein n=1 Tax=Pleuronectes platessa TaxID=8262 RepID=A0A9N7VKB0_PLEPL|nr:unnamed protein product [Pleuronectes platessa]
MKKTNNLNIQLFRDAASVSRVFPMALCTLDWPGELCRRVGCIPLVDAVAWPVELCMAPWVPASDDNGQTTVSGPSRESPQLRRPLGEPSVRAGGGTLRYASAGA